jgi:hypothetical protein
MSVTVDLVPLHPQRETKETMFLIIKQVLEVKQIIYQKGKFLPPKNDSLKEVPWIIMIIMGLNLS